ncbi:MFS transporter [Xaviernesmea oryzae]|uniref:MFS transporter n=1 Tax=Xaviernesmea oryzae TaxID=464029 RepID=A0A1Q9AUQ0_9HYPH|nr:MFS transporter [Xaviernesmea oryzae]OLP59181.1 MFS transporter [Xaviernesmea oryzae]SEK82817.1 drug resistance transporter, EmrB/QacA subfamily [Xaviernesmea oryzae]
MITSISPKNLTARNMAALAAVCLSALMLGLEISSIPAILPTLEQVLPADFRQLQWIMNAYTLAMTASLMAAGALADRFGRKRVFLIGIVLFGLASLACGLATTATTLIVARFAQGMSGATMLACQIAVLSHQFQNGPARGLAFSSWGVLFGSGLGFGPLIGGLVAALISWEWVFLVHVLLAVLTFVLAKTGVAESRDPQALRIDLPGIVSLSVAVFCLVYGITSGQGLGDREGLATFGLGLASFLTFLVVERRTRRPMFDFAVFRNRRFSGALLGASGMNFSFWPFVIYLPIYVQAIHHLDSVTAGLMLLSYTLPTLIMPPFAERLLARRGPGFVIPLGLFTIGLGFLVLRLTLFDATAGAWSLLPGCLIAGVGLGLTNTPVTNTATAAVSAERAGMASGMDMSARMISLAVNIALMGFILLRGVRLALQEMAPTLDGDQLAPLSEMIAAGNLVQAQAGGLGPEMARMALINGFGGVMLYGVFCAWSAAVLSLVLFGRCGRERPMTA